ncbi:hypothetical protein HanRHA438_Chr10g0454011 [Helianthus annuus]|nr:hypothetical protein HanRHA438_Chr10g0454011 [Helianthus annuus]
MVSASTSMKMKGYSKINLMNTKNNSKSPYFSDQTIKTPTPQNPISTKKSPTPITQHQTKILYDDDYDYNHYSGNQEQDEHLPMENLRINQSATSQGTTTDANSRFKIEKQHSTGRTLHTAVKRVLSVGRSSSVSERYARIHDQYVSDPFDVEEDDQVLQMGRSKNIMKKRSSILKACKRIFGL